MIIINADKFFDAGFQELSVDLVEAAVAHCQLIVVSKWVSHFYWSHIYVVYLCNVMDGWTQTKYTNQWYIHPQTQLIQVFAWIFFIEVDQPCAFQICWEVAARYSWKGSETSVRTSL